MYVEFSQISLLSMSNSEAFLVKDDDGGIDLDVLKRPSLEFQPECQAAATSSSHDIPDDGDREGDVVLGDHEDKNEDESNVTASKEIEKKKKRKISLGEFKATDEDDDDGFKTPTSFDQKIPAVMKQCPPAPRKPKPRPSSKTKAPSTPLRDSAAAAPTRSNLPLDLSQELESLFPKPLLADLHRKVKKART